MILSFIFFTLKFFSQSELCLEWEIFVCDLYRKDLSGKMAVNTVNSERNKIIPRQQDF